MKFKLKFWQQSETDDFKVVIGKPPVFDMVALAFQINPINALFCYGKTIYNPSGMIIPQYLIEHEKVHMEQQGFTDQGAALWWGKFLRDPEFRINQEAQAYGRQYQFMCETMKQYHGIDAKLHLRSELARILAGPLYNYCVSHSEAMGLIKKYAGEYVVNES